MPLHSSRTAACCVRGGPFPVQACGVWMPDLCAVWVYDFGAGVRDEDTSRQIWSCTSHQVGTRHALNVLVNTQFWSRDRNCPVFKKQSV